MAASKTKATASIGREPAHSLLYSPRDLPPVSDPPDTSVLREKVELSLANRLNARQADAFASAFSERLTLLWGPPGTGKTDTLAAVLLGWLERAWAEGKPVVLGVGSSNWTAIDNILRKLLELLDRRRQHERPEMDLWVARVRGDHSSAPPADLADLVWDVRRRSPDAGSLWRKLSQPDGCLVVAGTWLQLVKFRNQPPSVPDLSDDEDLPQAEAEDESEQTLAEAAPEHGWFDLLVLDEASQVKVGEAAGYFLLSKSCANVVLAGDDRQLGPVYAVPMKEDEGGLLDCTYRFYRERHAWTPVSLSMNYRTNQEISIWPESRFYTEGYEAFRPARRLQLAMPVAGSKPNGWPDALPWSDAYFQLVDPDAPVVVVTYPAKPYTMFNPFEAGIAASLACLYRLLLAAQGETDVEDFWRERLGVVTPHRAQMSAIRNILVDQAGFPPEPVPAVDTVDRFQGQERDFIIASYAVADRDYVSGEEGFILDPRRFNVTLTRARSKFVMLVSDAILRHLPSDRQVAMDAAHLQLFVDRYCRDSGGIDLPAPDGGTWDARLRLRGNA